MFAKVRTFIRIKALNKYLQAETASKLRSLNNMAAFGVTMFETCPVFPSISSKNGMI